jgi:DNA polymerase I
MTRPTFLLVDGHSLAFRSYYAFAYRADGGLRTSTGIPTSICFGFLKSLLEILDREQPIAVAIAFDLATPTFRHEVDSTYKAGRPETPEDFIPDLENLQKILAAMNLSAFTLPGFEADDIIGTLSQRASKEEYAVKILSGDRDMFQLVDGEKHISVLYLNRADKINELHTTEVQEKMGILPAQVVDFKALCGDSSDNIPGVRGIGEKTAIKLLSEYENLESILAAIPTMKGAIAKKLAEGIDAAKHSQFMARINLESPIEVSLEECKLTGFDNDQLIPLLRDLEFKAFINRIDDIQAKLGGVVAPKPVQEPKNTSEEDGDLWFDFAATETQPNPTASLKTLELDVMIVDTAEKLVVLQKKLQSSDYPTTWDTETTSLSPHDAELVGIGCCWGESTSDVAYIPIAHTSGQCLGLQEAIVALKPFLESDRYQKVLQNAKFDRLIFKSVGIELKGVIFDTMIASYVIDPEASHGLSEMSRQLLGLETTSYKDLVGKRKSIAEVSIPDVANYCGADVYTTYSLYPILKAQLEENLELLDLFQQIELPLEPVLASMEWYGIRIDKEYLAQFSEELETDLEAIATSAYTSADKEFNLNSPKQLSEILLELLGDRFTKKSRKSKTGYSTDVAVLNKLQGEHPLIDAILEHRTLAKLKSTYVDALPALINPKTQRVHTDFNQTVTTTGRLSSSNPNLQNIPIRTSFSRRIRAGFLPEAGWSLVSADYSQIELRILAHLSQEPELVKAYNQGDDVHTRTAQILLEKTEISSEERRLAKIINYGVIYGMGAQKFSRETGVSVGEAKKFIDAFNNRYARIFSYMQGVETEVEEKGFVTTVTGRRRYFREIKHLSGHHRAAALRSAVNAPIQGTSADIIKVAMIKLHELLQNYQTRLLLQVHDELVFEVPPHELEELQPLIKSVMELAMPLSVPLVVDVHRGKNWMEAK